MRRIPRTAQTLLTAALILGMVAVFALPALGASAGDDPIVQQFLTPTPNPTPSIYTPVYPVERSPESPLDLLPIPDIVPTKEPPSLEGRLAGVDVSHWQGHIHWVPAAASGISFVVTKATEGTGYRDPTYGENRRGAKAAGLAFTAYDYATPTPRARDAQRDADHFLAVAHLTPDDLVPVLDLEDTGGTNKDQLARWVRAWSDRVYTRLGVRPMIYVSPAFWMGPMRDTLEHAQEGHPLWIAHWHMTEPWVPASRWNNQGWTLWQWTDNGTVPGIRGPVDMNVYSGTDLMPLTIAGARTAQAAPATTLPVNPAPSPARGADQQQQPDQLPTLNVGKFLEQLLF